jgi:endonuclease/exonuclease/phosphatase family metal-dependent hydrolase
MTIARHKRRPARSRIRVVSWCNLAVVLLAWFCLGVVSERHWMTSALVYLPRSGWALGSVLLLPLAAWRDRIAAVINLAALVVVAWPIMGFSGVGRLLHAPAAAEAAALRVVSCNVQSFRPDFAVVLNEIAQARPDLIALQEAFPKDHRLADLYPDWHFLHRGEFLVASRWQLSELALFPSPIGNRDAALACRVELPRGSFCLVVVHPISARHGLRWLTSSTLLDERQLAAQERFLRARAEEAWALRAFIERQRAGMPLLVMGDFNMPSDSSLYRECFGDFQNAFEQRGCGYGYTAPLGGPGPWPRGLPWLRVDHVLTDGRFTVEEAWVGRTNGSDHRLIGAVLCVPDVAASAHRSDRNAAFSSNSAGGSLSPMPRR